LLRSQLNICLADAPAARSILAIIRRALLQRADISATTDFLDTRVPVP
jgi:hypothetical protein